MRNVFRSIPLLLISAALAASPHAGDSLAVVVVEALNRNDLAAADRIIDAELLKDSNSLEWLFFKGMRHYAGLFGESVNQEALEGMRKNLGRVMELGERRLDEDPDDSVALFYAGGASGYLGIAFAADGSMFKGVSTAKQGFGYQEHLLELHPDCYDAYLGPGLMNLMTSASPWILKPILYLLGLSGTEERALECLTLAYEKGPLVRIEAGTYLAQLYERKKDLAAASRIYLGLTTEYPMRIALRAESMSSLFSQNRYDDIIALGTETLQSFEDRRYLYTSTDSSRVVSIVISTAYAHRKKRDIAGSSATFERFLHEPAYQRLGKWRIEWEAGDVALAWKDTATAVRYYRAVVAGDAPEKYRSRVQDKLDALLHR